MAATTAASNGSSTSSASASSTLTKRLTVQGTDVEDYVEHFASNKRIRSFDAELRQVSSESRYAAGASELFRSIAWNCDGTQLACGSSDSSVNAATFELTGKFRLSFLGRAHSGSVDKVAWHPSNPNVLASTASDRAVCVWDVRQKAGKPSKITTKAANHCVAWSPCGDYLVLGGTDDRLNLVDGRTFNIINTLDFNKTILNEFAYHPSGKYLLLAMGGGKLNILTMPDMTLWRSIQAHSAQSNCISLAISSSGDKLALGGNDALCSLWNTADLTCDGMITRLDYLVRSVSFSFDEALLAAGSEEHTVDVAFVEDSSRVAAIPIESGTFDVAWHPKAHLLAISVGGEQSSRDSRDAQAKLKVFGFPSC